MVMWVDLERWGHVMSSVTSCDRWRHEIFCRLIFRKPCEIVSMDDHHPLPIRFSTIFLSGDVNASIAGINKRYMRPRWTARFPTIRCNWIVDCKRRGTTPNAPYARRLDDRWQCVSHVRRGCLLINRSPSTLFITPRDLSRKRRIAW